jgi:hypothetical protein
VNSYSQAAAGGDSFTPADYFGALLLVYPKAYTASEQTKHGDTQAADVDVVVVDRIGPDGKPLVFHDTRLFGNLARSVRVLLEADGSPKKYLGRLDQEPTSKGSPAWVLRNWTDADVQLAEPVRMAFEAGQFAKPVQAANPMAPAPAAYSPGPATPAAAPVAAAPAQQQWTAPAATAPAAPAQWQGRPSAPAPTGAPQQQQWSPTPAPTPAPPAPAAPAAPVIDPGLLQYLAARGVNGPFPDQATAEAIARTLSP